MNIRQMAKLEQDDLGSPMRGKQLCMEVGEIWMRYERTTDAANNPKFVKKQYVIKTQTPMFLTTLNRVFFIISYGLTLAVWGRTFNTKPTGQCGFFF